MRERDPRTGEQLELALDDVRLKIPWEGRSPRGLTRVRISSIFKAQAEKSVSDFVNPDQIEMSQLRQESPLYEGAPLLSPLLHRRVR